MAGRRRTKRDPTIDEDLDTLRALNLPLISGAVDRIVRHVEGQSLFILSLERTIRDCRGSFGSLLEENTRLLARNGFLRARLHKALTDPDCAPPSASRLARAIRVLSRPFRITE